MYQIVILARPLAGEGLFCLRAETERLFLHVRRDHPAASHPGVGFAEMDGASFLMVSEVGFRSRVVRERMPASRFLLQATSRSCSRTLPSAVQDGVGRGVL